MLACLEAQAEVPVAAFQSLGDSDSIAGAHARRADRQLPPGFNPLGILTPLLAVLRSADDLTVTQFQSLGDSDSIAGMSPRAKLLHDILFQSLGDSDSIAGPLPAGSGRGRPSCFNPLGILTPLLADSCWVLRGSTCLLSWSVGCCIIWATRCRRRPSRKKALTIPTGTPSSATSTTGRPTLAAGQPVISVDTKKKELVGEYTNGGREWRPAGEPSRSTSTTSPTPRWGTRRTRTGSTTWPPTGLGVRGHRPRHRRVRGRDDPPLVEPDRPRPSTPTPTRLLITADGGGSNGYRTRAWKTELAALAAETGLAITVCHFPPGTSKWNKIEHRLFSHITDELARRTTDRAARHRRTPSPRHDHPTGLTVHAELDTNSYPTGVKITDEQNRRPTPHPPRLPRRLELHTRPNQHPQTTRLIFAASPGDSVAAWNPRRPHC